MTELTAFTELTELTELTVLTMLTVETVKTVQTEDLKKYVLLCDSFKARDAIASKNGSVLGEAPFRLAQKASEKNWRGTTFNGGRGGSQDLDQK